MLAPEKCVHEKKPAQSVVFSPRLALNLCRIIHRPIAVRLKSATLILVSALFMASSAQAAVRMGPGSHVNGYAGVSWYLLAFELGPWEEYLIQELTPNLERLTVERVTRISWMHLEDELIIPDFAAVLLADQRAPLLFSLRQRRAALMLGENAGGPGGEGVQFEQSLLMPGVTHQVSERSAVTVSAVLASQRFGATGMNLSETDRLASSSQPLLTNPYHQPEVVHGAGLRLALSSELLSNLTVEAAYQSRIDMAEFASVQGVHGSRAELDIPSRIHLGLQFHATSRASLNLGVEQIFYSEVGAFPSRALPARFNALLGDSTSPDFNWNDLIVYNLGWQWRHDSDLTFYLDYRTRSQPKPSAPALASALGPELAQNAILAGVSKGLGERSQFRLNAAYAPPEFAFGGNIMGIVTDKLDQSVEVLATLSFDF